MCFDRRPTSDLPEGWEKHRHASGKWPSTPFRTASALRFYYINTKTQETTWSHPGGEKSEWQRRESSKFPGKFYLYNPLTNETKWQ